MIHDIEKIKQLLDLYYQGVTTPEQERELAEFFSMPDVELPAEMLPDRDLFRTLADAVVPPDLGDSLATAVDTRAAVRHKTLSPLRRWVGMAVAVAIVGLMAGGVVTYIHHTSSQSIVAPYKADDCSYAHITGDQLSPEQIGSQASNAIALLSRTLSYANLENDKPL